MAVKDNIYARVQVEEDIKYLQTPLVTAESDQLHTEFISKDTPLMYAICVTNSGSLKRKLMINDIDYNDTTEDNKDFISAHVEIVSEEFSSGKNYISIVKLKDLKKGYRITTVNTAKFQPSYKFSSMIFLIEASNVTYFSNYTTEKNIEKTKFVNEAKITGYNKTYYCIATSEYQSTYLKTPNKISIDLTTDKTVSKEETLYSALNDNKASCIIKKFNNLNKDDIIKITTFGFKNGTTSDQRGVAIFVEV